MHDLVDLHYPQADVVRVVLDNLSTHSHGALYEAFPAPEARRIFPRLDLARDELEKQRTAVEHLNCRNALTRKTH
jgi:hypothetical protein